jgi:phosphatidylinositol alpha 1,6-mannosyltransferase
MRVAIVTESFPPDVNGVANSVLRVCEHLVARGHEPMVIAPQPATGRTRVPGPLPYPVHRVASVAMPGYPGFRLGLPSRQVLAALRGHNPDVVHLASPFVLGSWGADAAAKLDLPVVAVYQTDVPGYAGAYGMAYAERTAWWWVRRIHARAARTLAPSTSTAATLMAHGIDNVWLWRRGVDTTLFHPHKRDEAVRRAIAPQGQTIVGYVGRLAIEKRIDLLATTARRPDIRVVIVGDGPARPALQKAMPDAAFVGERHGLQLARLYASLDVFVHTGPLETFCQAVQEAMASGVPVVAPAIGGPLDLVRHGHTGYLVPPLDSAAIDTVVTTLAADPALAMQLGRTGRAMVEDRTWTAIGDELLAHYQAVTGSGGPDTPSPLAIPQARPAPATRRRSKARSSQ